MIRTRIWSMMTNDEKEEWARLSDEIVSGSNLPGRILHLNRVVINEFLDALQEKGEIIVNRTAGLDIVYPAAMHTQQEILNTYYRGR